MLSVYHEFSYSKNNLSIVKIPVLSKELLLWNDKIA